jgi:hypothetical protein
MKVKMNARIFFALMVLLQSCAKVLASPPVSSSLNNGTSISNIETSAAPGVVAANCGLYGLYIASTGLCEIVCFSLGSILALRALKNTSPAFRMRKLVHSGGLFALAFLIPYASDLVKF